MNTRTAFKIMLCAILAYFAEFYLFKITNIQFFDPGDDVHFIIFYGLVFFTISLILASALSGVLGFFSMKKYVSIWVFLGIFFAGVACSIYYLYVLWQSYHFYSLL
jgi:hypothetical protein